jgi:hypothetical protein
MDALRHLVLAACGGRARPGPPPSEERLLELSRLIAERRYRASPHEVAEAMLRGPAVRRG